MSRHPIIALVLAACGPPPVAAPRPAERPVASAADIAGKWLASDDLDWSYALTIAADGGFDLVIDRGKLGACTQHGILHEAKRNELAVAYTHDECHRSVGGELSAARLVVTSFTGDALAIDVIAGRIDERQAYRRAPQ